MGETEKPTLNLPDKFFQDTFKEFTSQQGFQVVWHCCDKNCTAPGYYIRLVQPKPRITTGGGTIKDEYFFKHGDEIEAQKKYDELVGKVKSWDNIQPPKKK